MSDHLIFDFDGTLFDPSFGLAAALYETFALHDPSNIHLVPKILLSIGPPMQDMLLDIVPDYSIRTKLVSSFRHFYDSKCCRYGYFYDGILDWVASAKANGYSCHIFTNKPFAPLRKILNFHDAGYLFDQLYCIDYPCLFADKTLMLSSLLAELNLDSCENVSVFGDSESDKLAAISNKCSFYGDLLKLPSDSFLPVLLDFTSL